MSLLGGQETFTELKHLLAQGTVIPLHGGAEEHLRSGVEDRGAAAASENVAKDTRKV